MSCKMLACPGAILRGCISPLNCLSPLKKQRPPVTCRDCVLETRSLVQHQGAGLLGEPQGLCFATTCESPRLILQGGL